eukprot:TRINITY_DN57933_c0_g1_i1.p1 TRINITY_DN57933_c0_g1~~TRINITY_DN57933_c0_g1_i1.p1  ORF type:complete len:257 (+),score=52.11 TRINITY_DN57933_c0_g1_i1:66-836(+)
MSPSILISVQRARDPSGKEIGHTVNLSVTPRFEKEISEEHQRLEDLVAKALERERHEAEVALNEVRNEKVERRLLLVEHLAAQKQLVENARRLHEQLEQRDEEERLCMRLAREQQIDLHEQEDCLLSRNGLQRCAQEEIPPEHANFQEGVPLGERTQGALEKQEAAEYAKLQDFLKLHGFKGVNVKRTKLFQGKYPLHSAVKRNDASMVKLLLKFGADPTLTNSSGATPAALARRLQTSGSHDEILALLTRRRHTC